MIILFLDDEDIRHALVEKVFGKKHRVLHAFNALEAIGLIQSYQDRIGLALLDHDLGEVVLEDGKKVERHGNWFVQQMVRECAKDKYPVQTVVHSYNENGAKKMVASLADCGIIASHYPFSGEMLNHIANQIEEA